MYKGDLSPNELLGRERAEIQVMYGAQKIFSSKDGLTIHALFLDCEALRAQLR